MKYFELNKPIQCIMTNSTCYKGTTIGTPVGVLWHSTGANNPSVKRYVQPSDNDSNRKELLRLIGTNSYRNDWNHINYQAGVNAFIGKIADGSVAAVQCLPLDYRPWGCGSGKCGSCNGNSSVKNSPFWLQFECCEDNLSNEQYFNDIYKEACELTAYFCKLYNLNPFGFVNYNGIQVPVILDHTTSHSLGLGSNHGDIQHWFKRFDKTFDDVRQDVYDLLNPKEGEDEEMTQEQFNTMMNNWIAEQAEKEPSSWSALSRAWAESAGLIKGNDDSGKMYRKPITREEFIEVMYRFAENLKKGIG